MVTRRRGFRRDESGISLIEGLIVFPLVLTVIITFVEFGYAVFQWSQTGKATAIGVPGVRVLVVDDHVIVRNGLSQLLATSEQFELVGAAGGDRAGDELRARAGDGAAEVGA